MKKYFTFLVVFLIFSSCSPKISYMGNSHMPTYDVDVYYDEKDIELEYSVMGIARNEGDMFENDDLNEIRNALIKKAREVGADAILVLSIDENRPSMEDDYDPNKIVEAKFLKYKG